MPVEINSTSQIQDLTSKTFHITQWTLLAFGIIGNSLVITWRCMRRNESNRRLLSVLIISLAFADLLICCQYLLKELMVSDAVFGSNTNTSDFRLTDVDVRLGFTSSILSFVSLNAIMFTVVAIALHAYAAISGARYGYFIVIAVVVTGWILSLTVAALVTSNLDKHQLTSLVDGSPESFTLVVYIHYQVVQYPIIQVVLCINGIASVVCSFLYIAILVKIRRLRKLAQQANSVTNLGSLQLRMTFIVFLNNISWWPPCILLWYIYLTGNTLINGRLDPRVAESGFVLIAVSSGVNPVIYTLSWKPFRQLVKRMCSFSGGSYASVEDSPGVFGREKRVCCYRLWRKKAGWDPMTSSDDTQETSAFDSNYQPL